MTLSHVCHTPVGSCESNCALVDLEVCCFWCRPEQQEVVSGRLVFGYQARCKTTCHNTSSFLNFLSSISQMTSKCVTNLYLELYLIINEHHVSKHLVCMPSGANAKRWTKSIYLYLIISCPAAPCTETLGICTEHNGLINHLCQEQQLKADEVVLYLYHCLLQVKKGNKSQRWWLDAAPSSQIRCLYG